MLGEKGTVLRGGQGVITLNPSTQILSGCGVTEQPAETARGAGMQAPFPVRGGGYYGAHIPGLL